MIYILFGTVVCVLLVLIYISSTREDLTPLTCTDPSRVFMVVNKDDKKEAACKLEKLSFLVEKLLRFLKDNRVKYTPRQTESVNMLLDKFNFEIIQEGLPTKDQTSYTLDKDKLIVWCIRQYDGKFVEDSIMIFVIIHEMAHTANKGWGHGNEDFWPIMKFLLREAVNAEVYKPVDYRKYPYKYASLNINHSPLFDAGIPMW